MKKFLRVTGILFMGITTVVTLLGGAGTTCVALNAAKYGPKFTPIANYQWLYILYVLIGIALGIMGFRATKQLVKGKENAEKSALITLIAGVVIGVIHIITSRALRGSSMPVDGVVYITALTLLIFLLFRLPKVREMDVFEETSSDNGSAAGGMTAFVAAALVLSVQMWVGPAHLLDGVNYADAFHNALQVIGWGLFLVGVFLFSKALLFQPEREPARFQP
jgi:Ca2+/Na+ antiporter